MIPHRDEILRPAVSTDATAVPRYNLVRPDGTIIEKNVAMRLSNPVAREGTPISKAALDEMLAASGVTAGTATAYTLTQAEYELFDGAPVRFRLHVASGDGATLNVNGTGAKPLHDMMGAALPGGIPAGTWLTANYSAAAGAYVLAGGEAVRALYGERYTVDDAVAYVKDVPGDALPAAEIGEVGGMTHKINVGTEANPVYELRSAAATAMQSGGVNLIPYPYAETTKTESGITFTDNGDGSIKINGTATQTVNFRLAKDDESIFANGEYHVELYNGNASNVALVIGGRESNIPYANTISQSLSITAGTIGYLLIQIPSGKTVNNITVYPMLNRGTTAQPYTPYFHSTLPIPEAVRALDGYGWGINETVRNYVDWKNREFGKMVGKTIFDGTEYWELNTVQFPNENPCFLRPLSKAKDKDTAICSHYEHKDHPYYQPIGTSGIFGWDSSSTHVYFASDLPSVSEWKAYLAEKYANGTPVTVFYPLPEPIITDISDILPADNMLPVEAGGTITAVNEYNYAVPTKITYQRNVLSNCASIFALEKLRLAMELLAKADLSNVSGTFGGVVKANAAAVSALGTAQVRNVTISSTDLSAGSTALATGSSYHVYS